MRHIIEGAPELAWELVTGLIDLPSDDALGYFAAGPLEDLIGEHGASFIDRVEERARTDPRFRRAVRVVRYGVRDDVWRRLERLTFDSAD